MNITVITTEPMDFGWGEDTRVEFVDADYHADNNSGILHVLSDRSDGSKNIAAFQRGDWRCVIKGPVVQHPDSRTGSGAGEPAAPLSMVRAANAGANR